MPVCRAACSIHSSVCFQVRVTTGVQVIEVCFIREMIVNCFRSTTTTATFSPVFSGRFLCVLNAASVDAGFLNHLPVVEHSSKNELHDATRGYSSEAAFWQRLMYLSNIIDLHNRKER